MRVAICLAALLLAAGSSVASSQEYDEDSEKVFLQWELDRAHCKPLKAETQRYNDCRDAVLFKRGCEARNTERAKIERCIDEAVHPEKYGKETPLQGIIRMRRESSAKTKTENTKTSAAAPSHSPAAVRPPGPQSISVAGRMTDRSSGLGAGGAFVWLQGTSHSAEADDNGNYRMANVPPGTYTLIVRRIGYENHTVRSVVIGSRAALTINAALEPTVTR